MINVDYWIESYVNIHMIKTGLMWVLPLESYTGCRAWSVCPSLWLAVQVECVKKSLKKCSHNVEP